MAATGRGGSAPTPPRKGAYSKHVQGLHKDQMTKLQSKNNQEIDLLEDIRTFVKQKSSIEKHYADALLKLSTSHLNHKLAAIPDIQKGQEGDDRNQEVNVYNLWRKFLEENEKEAKTKLALVQVFHDEVEKDVKVISKAKQAKSKMAFERLANVQKDLQISVAELDRTKRIYFCEESGALEVKDKAKDAEEKAKGLKKDLKSLFQSKSTLSKKAGILSAKQEELDIKSTGARNDYILNLASCNAQQDRYYKHDLQDTMQYLEGDFYERLKGYMSTIANAELQTVSSTHTSFVKLKDLADTITRLYNYECYTKVYPSLGQHITYEHEAPPGDEIKIITPSEHDGGYSLNYEARQNASKLNQSVKTIKAYHKRIKACHFHKSKGLKHEPNDTGGPDLDTKINELEVAIRNAETERAKAEARIEKLREGGVAVDEFIDAFVASYDADARNDNGFGGSAAEAIEQANAEWGSHSAEPASQEQEEDKQAYDYSEQQPDQDIQADNQEGWASWEQHNEQPEENEAATDWAQSKQWGTSTDQQQQDIETEAVFTDETATTAIGRTALGVAIYEFQAQNEDELNVMENERVTIFLDECDEEGWLMGMNTKNEKGYVPQNYIELDPETQQPEEPQPTDNNATQHAYNSQDSYTSNQYQSSDYDYGRQDSVASYQGGGYGRQDSVASQGGAYGRQDSVASQGSNYGGYARQDSMASQDYAGYSNQGAGMETIPEQHEQPNIPVQPPPAMDTEEEEEDSSAEEESCSLPPGLPPGPPPPGPPPAVVQQALQKPQRPPSISLSASIDSKDFCRAVYDYDATGSDEISFEETDIIKVLKRCPNGVDDGWWLGEFNNKVGLFPSLMVEEITDDETPDASSMTSPPSMGPPSFANAPPPLPPPVVPPPVPNKVLIKPSPVPEKVKSPPEVSVPKHEINITAASPEIEEKSLSEGDQKRKEEPQTSNVSKPAVPCVQVSVDEVPDIPADDDEEQVKSGGGLDAMEIVVTAPTPTVQSPVSEETNSVELPKSSEKPLSKTNLEETVEEKEEDQNASASDGLPSNIPEPIVKMEEDLTQSEDLPPPPPVNQYKAAKEEEKQLEEKIRISSGGEEVENKIEKLSESHPNVLERHSSADSSVSSSLSSSSQIQKKNTAKSSSSSSGSGSGPDEPSDSEEEVKTESDLPLPPDQLELKQLKKLDSMKESNA